MGIIDLLKQGNYKLIDVRSPDEFYSGSVEGAENIPVNNIHSYIEQIKEYKKPIVVFCASGGRSGVANEILKANGIESYNGGPWYEVDMLVSKTK